jgi:hypothetical protein
MDAWFPCIMLAAILFIGALSSFIVLYLRYTQDISPYLIDDLRRYDLSIVAIEVGPFPKIEWRGGGPISEVNGIRGEYALYRIVTVSDPNGDTFRLWAQLEFVIFQFDHVRWRAEEKQALPKHILPLLEC